MDDFDFYGFDFDTGDEEKKKPRKTESEEKPAKTVKPSHRFGNRHLSRKASSEQALMKSLDWFFEEGDCYHCFSFGDVDSMSYFKHVLHQQRILYLALSTWCMAGEDIEDLREWHHRGMLGRVDFYLGEIFQGSYPEVYAETCDFVEECGGRLCIFRNHSKVMAIVGEKFDCLIESSANVNTNPRCENTVLTVDKTLVADYVEMFNGIESFNKEHEAEPYKIPKIRKLFGGNQEA